MLKQIPKAWVLMMKKSKKEKFLIINNFGVVYNTVSKIMTAGRNVRNNNLIIDFTITDVEEDDLAIAVILCNLLYPNQRAIKTSFTNLMHEYILFKG